MKKKYPIGLQSFRKIREGGYLYVDKTEVIYDLVDSGIYYFLSRPRRFGKSLLISTIEELFSGSKELFEGLWIYDRWDWNRKNPVIHFNFAELPYVEIGLRDALKTELDKIAEKHAVTLATDTLVEQFRELIEKVSTHGKVVILIDEYDKPLIDYLNDPDKVDENRSIMKSFYSVLKGQDANIRFLMLTGVSRFSRVSIFSDLNHLSDITLVDDMNDIVGITQQELETNFSEDLERLADKFGKSLADIKNHVKLWYNGYSWGGEHTLYNPFSLLSLFRWKSFDNYWFQTGTPSFFYELIQRNPNIPFPDTEVVAGQEGLMDLFGQKTHYEGPEKINPVTLMFQTGYLTIKSYDFPTRSYILDYPNLEVRESTKMNLLSGYSFSTFGNVRPTIIDLTNAFRKNDLERVTKLIDTLFVNIPNTLWSGATEKFYHAIIHNTFDLIGIMMESERNYAGIRPDIAVFTASHIYVLEFKLDGTAEDALKQIIDREYLRPFQMDKREKVAVGVNFSSKKKGIEDYMVKIIDK